MGGSPAVSRRMVTVAAPGKHVRQTFLDEPENGLLKLVQVAYEGCGTFAVSGGRTIKTFAGAGDRAPARSVPRHERQVTQMSLFALACEL